MEGGAAQLPNQQPSLEQLPEGEQAVNNNKLLKPTSWAQNINRIKCDWIGAKHCDSIKVVILTNQIVLEILK